MIFGLDVPTDAMYSVIFESGLRYGEPERLAVQ